MLAYHCVPPANQLDFVSATALVRPILAGWLAMRYISQERFVFN